MSALTGTVVIDKLVPTDSADTYGTHEDKYGIGGLHADVLDIAERNAIPVERRKEGMVVYVKQPTPTNYQLIGGITNADWTVFLGLASIIPKKEPVTPTLGQTVYVLTETPLADSISFLLNGVELEEDYDYTVLGTTITLSAEYGVSQPSEIQISSRIVIKYLY